MTFLAPWFLAAAAVAALGVVALHLLSTRDPRIEILPTVRFLPELPVRAQATTVRPSDPWLLLLRVLLVMLIGAALARPVLNPPRDAVARIIAIDVSRAVGDAVELADSAAAHTDDAAAVILFDSRAREVDEAVGDTLRALAGMGFADREPASLSAALIASLRAAARIRDRADSLELVVISPFVAEQHDAATDHIRALWPGRVTAVTITSAGPDPSPGAVRVEWADSAVADDGQDGPRATAVGHWLRRDAPDTVAALRVHDVVLVHPFERRWRLAEPADGDTRVIARWADGEPAGIERRIDGLVDGGRPTGTETPSGVDAGCIRSFGFALPADGDAALRPAFLRFADGLEASCGDPRDFRPLPKNVMAALQGDGPLAPTADIERRVRRATPLTPWLLLAGAVLALIELLVRGRGGGAAARLRRNSGSESLDRAA